jgi:HK97 family phage portal protein
MIARRLASALLKAASYLNPVFSTVGGWTTVAETFTGSWQQDVPIDRTAVSANWAVFSCVTLIAGDIAKMPARVMQYSPTSRIWEPTDRGKVLRKPNRYQTRIEFFQNWVLSLLLFGNAYVLKQRDEQGRIVALYILDPARVHPLVAEDGGVYYELHDDVLAQIEARVVVPASEMIHDRMYTPWHPLIGVSPLYACGLAAMQGSHIQSNSANFFKNKSMPGGVLTAPGSIPKDTAERVRTQWQDNYSGANAGKVAVLGDGLEYKAIGVNAVDAQLMEQLKFTGEMICATFHVPPYKLGLGQMPTTNNVAALNQQYYEQALQPIVEKMELRLDEGLGLEQGFETWMDETVLVRMDPSTRLEAHNKAVGGGWKSPDEVRREENLPPVEGGATPYLQQQNYSLAALAKRDASEDPFGKKTATAPASPVEPDDDDETMSDDEMDEAISEVADEA